MSSVRWLLTVGGGDGSNPADLWPWETMFRRQGSLWIWRQLMAEIVAPCNGNPLNLEANPRPT